MPHIETRAGRVMVDDRGQGPPLVLLHANGHDHHDFDAILPALAAFRTIAIDWPGCGESDLPRPPSSAGAGLCCDVLEDVLSALDVPAAVLLGNSVGGTAALRLAGRRPGRVRALVLVDPGGLVAPSALQRAFCWVQGRELVRRLTGMAFARAYLKRRNAHAEALLGRHRAHRARPGRIALDAAMWRSFGRPEADVSAEAQTVRCPTLVIWGRLDPVLRARVEGRRARQLLPHARYLELDTGHVPFVEDPQAFLDGLLPFLAELPAASSTGVAL